MEAYDKNWDRTASAGMGDVQKPHRRRTTRPSNRRQIYTMLPEPGPYDIGRHASLSGVESVHCPTVSGRSIKYALWHDGDPFVLERRMKRTKKCRGCGKEFVDEKFIVRHEEKIYFVKNDIRRETISKVSCHCRPRCILRRHSDFDTNELVVKPNILSSLNASDLK